VKNAPEENRKKFTDMVKEITPDWEEKLAAFKAAHPDVKLGEGCLLEHAESRKRIVHALKHLSPENKLKMWQCIKEINPEGAQKLADYKKSLGHPEHPEVLAKIIEHVKNAPEENRKKFTDMVKEITPDWEEKLAKFKAAHPDVKLGEGLLLEHAEARHRIVESIRHLSPENKAKMWECIKEMNPEGAQKLADYKKSMDEKACCDKDKACCEEKKACCDDKKTCC